MTHTRPLYFSCHLGNSSILRALNQEQGQRPNIYLLLLISISQHPSGKPLPSLASSPPPPQPLTTRNPLSVSVDLPVLDVSHQWNHTLCVPLRLASLTEHRVLRVRPHVSECQGFSPFHGWVMVPCVEGPCGVYLSSVDGHLGCSSLGCCESCCCKHSWTSICLNIFFQVFWVETHGFTLGQSPLMFFLKCSAAFGVNLDNLCFSKKIIHFVPVFTFISIESSIVLSLCI